MHASTCINPEIPFLSPEDKGLTALGLMEELKLTEMPLVAGEEYVGLINEMDLLDYECIEGQLSDIQNELKRPFVLEGDHMFEVVGLMVSEELTVLPVLSEEEKYVGAIDQMSALQSLGRAEAFHSPGGVIKLEMDLHDYSMAEISRIVESNDGKILLSYFTPIPETNKILVTIKTNKADLNRMIQTFNRFGYNITASYHKDEYEEDLKRRYESFLRYLNT